jgi:hypothetical protein
VAKRKLRSITIRPGKNGGHSVQHQYEPAPQFSKGMSGGLTMGAPEMEDHSFGPGDHGGLVKHLAQALALKNTGGASGLGGPQE